jgi:predicted PurR-regulated permease PerM
MSLAKGPLSYVGRWVDLSKYDLNAMISANMQKVSVWLVGFGANVLSGIARFIIDALITFVVVFFLFRDGAQWAYRAGSLLPLSREQVVRLYRNISDTIIANVYGILSVGVAQGVLLGVVLRFIGMQSALLLGLATGFASIIPVVGSALVWGPVVIYLLMTGSIGKGLFLLVYCVVIVSCVDNILRPWVVGGRVGLHPLVLLFFIFGGVEAFGFLGLFLGPVVASVLVALFDILREELNEAKTLPAAGGT